MKPNSNTITITIKTSFNDRGTPIFIFVKEAFNGSQLISWGVSPDDDRFTIYLEEYASLKEAIKHKRSVAHPSPFSQYYQDEVLWCRGSGSAALAKKADLKLTRIAEIERLSPEIEIAIASLGFKWAAKNRY